MGICDNKPFEQSEEKLERLKELLNVPINDIEVTLLPGYDDNSKDKNEHFASSQIYSGHTFISVLFLCILNDTRDTNPSPKHFMFINDLTGFKQCFDVKNRNLSRNKKYRFCDFSGSQTTVQNHEEQVYRDQVDDRDQYELESQQTHLWFQTNDSKCRHR